MTRPATKSVIPVAAVWKATPRQNTAHEKMTPSLRPIPSATGAARSAPKNVPAERIDLLNIECRKGDLPEIKVGRKKVM